MTPAPRYSSSDSDELRFPLIDRLSYLWLVVALIILSFTNGIGLIIPIAVWIGPVFLVRYLRTQKLFPGLLLGYVVVVGTFFMQWNVAFKDAGAMFGLYTGIFGLMLYVPYLLDRLLRPRLSGFLATLIFPVSAVTIEYILHLALPLGTFFSAAYTQAENLPLLQLAAVTGHWGITFLAAWCAGIANYAWEGDFDITRVGRGVVAYGLIVFLVLFLGGLRLAVFRPKGETVKVAALNSTIDEEVIPEPETERDGRLLAGTLTEEDFADMTRIMTAIQKDLITRTREQAQSGAKIVTWTEYSAEIWKADEAEFLAQLQELTREEAIYLAVPLATIQPDVSLRSAPELVVENKSVMLTPEGEIAYEYLKHNLLIGWESEHAVRGPRVIRTIDTPYGRLASVVCLDMEYPAFMRLASQQRVDIMLSGAIDGTPSTEGDPLHSIMASYRTIENGFSLARAGYRGQLVVVDYQGRMLARTNHFTATDRVAVAEVPVHGVWTPYSVLGDYFPMLCMVTLTGSVVIALMPRRRQPVPVAAPA